MNKKIEDYDAQIKRHEDEIKNRNGKIVLIKRRKWIAEKKKALLNSAPEMIELLAKIYCGELGNDGGYNDPLLKKYYNASHLSDGSE